MNRSALFPAIALLTLLHLPAAGGALPAADSGPAARNAPVNGTFAWLEGEWVRESRRGGTIVERWIRVSRDTMEGTATVSSGEATRITEHLRLETFGDEVFYTAKPAENPFPTPFKLVDTDRADGGAARYVFENPGHDFPQRIIYMPEGEDGLLVRIEAMAEGESKGIDFRFRRKL